MPDIYTPEQVAECKHIATRGRSASYDVWLRKQVPALCATIETLRSTIAAKEETLRALESENAELMGVVRELGEMQCSPNNEPMGWYFHVPRNLILRARELSR